MTTTLGKQVSKKSPSSEARRGGRHGPRYLKLIPIGEARRMIGLQFKAVGSELVSVDRSMGRVCVTTIRSKLDIPKSTTSAMDGYAIRSEDTRKASPPDPCRLRIRAPSEGQHGAGVVLRRGEAVAVSTGAELPRGSDAVLRVEQARVECDNVLVSGQIPKWKNISFAAEDVRVGQVLLRKGDMITAAGMALLMSAGIARVRVRRILKVGIISVGERLTSFGRPSPGRTVSNYANLTLGYLSELGTKATILGIVGNDASEASRLIERAARDFDMVMTIGSASVGSGDLAPDAVLRCPGSKMVFHGLRAVPLRPVGLASVGGKPVVLLPGHAVSAALSFFVIALPVLNQVSGLKPDSRTAMVEATTADEFSNGRPMDAYLLATLKKRGGAYTARPLGWGSNLQSNLALANGFVHLGRGESVPAGRTIEVELFGSSQILRVEG